MKDYYKVLGVSEKATKAEIKKAFHTMAKKYHPDINKGDKSAEEKFKEVSEAYEVLGNEEKKRNYDNARIFGGGFNFDGFSENGPFGNFYKKYTNRTRSNYYSSKKSSEQSTGGYQSSYSDNNDEDTDLFTDFINSFAGSFSGTPFDGISSVFGNVINKAKSFTSGGSKDTSTNNNVFTTVKIPLDIALNGGGVEFRGLPGGARRVDIPPNTASDSYINVGPYTLKIEVEKNEHFVVIGKNIKTTLSINIAQAVLGGKVRFTDPRGNSVILVVPKETKQGDKVKLTGLGFPGGDLFVEFDILIPKNLTEEQRRIFSDACDKIGLKH